MWHHVYLNKYLITPEKILAEYIFPSIVRHPQIKTFFSSFLQYLMEKGTTHFQPWVYDDDSVLQKFEQLQTVTV